MKTKILGNISTKQFLREYWQKKPLLIRQAFPDFKGLLNKKELIALACETDAQSRLISSQRNTWQLTNSPFQKKDFAKLPDKWTLLVQDVNHFLPAAQTLMQQFNFIPYVRLDDVMVSFAPDGAGVGPHFDSYDVFLLQGMGKRLWQISQQSDKQLLPDSPLRILKNFKPEQEYLLESGDMLYLPPNYAHNGIAVGECMTYSIGFRAASTQELTQEFLIYLQDHLQIEGIYTDPDLQTTKNPAAVSMQMINKVSKQLEKIQFGKKQVGEFLGKYLSEPKQHVYFDSPELPISKKKFLKLGEKNGVCLDLKSQMLFTSDQFFINGEEYSFCNLDKKLLKKFADEREIKLPEKLDHSTADLFYEWYLCGYSNLVSE